jgi:hypothetical protein
MIGFVPSPTMRGFTWSTQPVTGPWNVEGDGWCVRDAFCALFRWQLGGEDAGAFIEGVGPEDMERLTSHLGLEWYDPVYRPHALELAQRLDHPGITCFNLRAVRVAHVVYQPHLRRPRPLPRQYHAYDPELFRVLVDVRQDPHSL